MEGGNGDGLMETEVKVIDVMRGQYNENGTTEIEVKVIDLLKRRSW